MYIHLGSLEAESSTSILDDMIFKVLKKVESTNDNPKDILGDISGMNQKFESYAIVVKLIEQQLGQIFIYLNQRNKCTLPSNKV